MYNSITATLVKDNQRLAFLPKHLGSLMLKFEPLIFQILNNICETYDGGYWHFYELSNGGFYMAPDMDDLLPIFIDLNGYEGKVSADAAGIIASMFALNYLCNESASDKIIDQYYLLRDFASCHSEANSILQAID